MGSDADFERNKSVIILIFFETLLNHQLECQEIISLYLIESLVKFTTIELSRWILSLTKSQNFTVSFHLFVVWFWKAKTAQMKPNGRICSTLSLPIKSKYFNIITKQTILIENLIFQSPSRKNQENQKCFAKILRFN